MIKHGFFSFLQKIVIPFKHLLVLLFLFTGCQPISYQQPGQNPIQNTIPPTGTSPPIQSTSTIPVDQPVITLTSPASPTESPNPDLPAEQIRKTLKSLKKINDFPFYTLVYEGDYGFDVYLQSLQAETSSSAKAVVERQESTFPNQQYNKNNITPFACTVFSARTPNNEFLLARNFDWYLHPILLLFTDSPNGYASASMVDISYLGVDRDTDLFAAGNAEALLRAPFLPFDGMNERGLAVGMMAVEHSEGFINAEKGTLDSLEIIRLLLDYAATVDEAVALLRQYNVDFGQGPAIHYLIADAGGSSVIVEYIDGKLHLTRSQKPWQISTNFLFSEIPLEQAPNVCWRYQTADLALTSSAGVVTSAEALAILERVSQEGTIWSMIYNQTSTEILVAIGRDFELVYPFDLFQYQRK